MTPIVCVYDEEFLLHRPPEDHPEQPDRLRAVLGGVVEAGVDPGSSMLSPAAATETAVRSIHTQRHIDFVRRVAESGGGLLDGGDTHASEESFAVALRAAGAAIAGVHAVLGGSAGAAFCAVRPPGHHAEADEPMGFCIFNNVAIAARYAQRHHDIRRVAILDWDVHHGNGTQHIFEDDPSVLFISLHQYPYYPGSGANTERGRGEGEGYTINIPFPAGTGEAAYLKAFQDEVLPALKSFDPGLLLISAGFDAHRDDPLGSIELTEESFGKLTTLVRDVAPIVSVLEGGYNLPALTASVREHLRALR